MNEITDFLAADVKRVLLKDWDPIGINDVPEAHDEYDSYVLRICGLLCAGETVDGVYRYLRWVEQERMGIDGDEVHTAKIAKELANLRLTRR